MRAAIKLNGTEYALNAEHGKSMLVREDDEAEIILYLDDDLQATKDFAAGHPETEKRALIQSLVWNQKDTSNNEPKFAPPNAEAARQRAIAAIAASSGLRGKTSATTAMAWQTKEDPLPVAVMESVDSELKSFGSMTLGNPQRSTSTNALTASFETAWLTPPSLTVNGEAIELFQPTPFKPIWVTKKNDLFKWCFGQVVIKCTHHNESATYYFDALMQRKKTENARQMIQYLVEQHNGLLDACVIRNNESLSRSKTPESSPEIVIKKAGEFLQKLGAIEHDLLRLGRTRLVPRTIPAWGKQPSFERDDLEILENFDCLTPSDEYAAEVKIRGRYYKLEGATKTALLECPDVVENQTLLGGLFSIQRALLQVKDLLSEPEMMASNHGEYERFDRVILSLTSNNLAQECNRLIEYSHGLIERLIHGWKISFKGEIPPLITPYVRNSKIYRPLFEVLIDWYHLGKITPSFSSSIKRLQSLSKIYEVFVYFKLVKQMIARGMTASIENAKSHPTLGKYVPTEVQLSDKKKTYTLYYEMIVHPFDQKMAEHGQLYDIHHSKGMGLQYNYWNPDFILRQHASEGKPKQDRWLENLGAGLISSSPGGVDQYYILDAKYTHANRAADLLSEVVDKYYWKSAVWNSNQQALSNREISGVAVIYPLGEDATQVKFMGRSFTDRGPLTVPLIGGLCLNVDSKDEENPLFEKLFKILGI